MPADDTAKKAYQLLLAAMEDKDLVGIGTVVMRNKQYLAAIRPLDGVLAMSTMRFADEIVPRSEIDDLPRRSKPDAGNLRIATQLLDAMSSDWDPRRYHDTFTEELRDRIAAKDKGNDVVEKSEGRRAERQGRRSDGGPGTERRGGEGRATSDRGPSTVEGQPSATSA